MDALGGSRGTLQPSAAVERPRPEGNHVIIRLFEGRLRTGHEHDFMAGERDLLARTDIDGLEGVSIGRRLAGGQMHVITLTIWRDRDALERFTHAAVDRPVFTGGSQEFVESWRLEHFEMDEDEARA